MKVSQRDAATATVTFDIAWSNSWLMPNGPSSAEPHFVLVAGEASGDRLGAERVTVTPGADLRVVVTLP